MENRSNLKLDVRFEPQRVYNVVRFYTRCMLCAWEAPPLGGVE